MYKSKNLWHCDENDGKFQKWLSENMNKFGWNLGDLAKILESDQWCISKILHAKHKPHKATVIALCWVFGMNDDPEDIWGLVKEDWV